MKRFWIILVSLILLGGAGFAGWKYWDQNRTKTNNQQQQYDPSENGKYLVIKEWGVRFELSENIKDAFYQYESNAIVYFSSATTNKIDGCKDKPIYGLRRAKIDEMIIGSTTVEEALKTSPDRFIKIEPYYYLFINSPFSCASQNDTDGKNKLANLRENLKVQVKTLEKVPTQ